VEYVLLVSWIFGAQASSYQTSFANRELCSQARAMLLDEAKRVEDLAGVTRQRRTSSGQTIEINPGVPPMLSVVCVKQK